MNVLKPDKKAAIITLLKNGISQREIHKKTKIHRETIRKYAEENNLLKQEAESENKPEIKKERVSIVIKKQSNAPPVLEKTETEQTGNKTAAGSACVPYKDWIEAQINLGRNAMAIYQDLVEMYGFSNKYNSVKRFVRKLKEKDPERYDHLDFPPGEEAQVDYGQGAKTRYKNGSYRKPRLFVMTLKYSGRSFRKTVWKSSQEIWAKLHEEAFRYFGGCTLYVVLDNLKEGVITADIYEPELNTVYAAMLKHYKVVADTARVGDPNRKGSVENAVKHTQDTALKGRKFESIEEQNEWLMHWEERWAKTRIHGRKKRQVEEMYLEEKPTLKALPVTSFRYFKEEVRTVWDDGTINFDKSYYSALPAPIYSKVMLRIYESEIEIYNPKTLEIIRRHRKSEQAGSFIMEEEDRIFNPSRNTEHLLKTALSIGPETRSLCQKLFDKFGRSGQRRMQGIINLARHYESKYIEQAAVLSVKNGLDNYKSFKKLVQIIKEKDKKPLESELDEVTQNHKLIRPMEDYAKFFKQHACGAKSALEDNKTDNETNKIPVTINREQLKEIWQNADWKRVIDEFGLKVDSKRRCRSDEIWIKSPFTKENNASVHLNTEKNIFKDFSSGKGAGEGILNFCQELLAQRGRKMNCYEVGRWMLEKGISTINNVGSKPQRLIKAKSVKKDNSNKEAEVNQPINIDLRNWFKEVHPELQKRKITKKTCRYLGCGYLPPDYQGKSKSPLNGRIVFQIRGIMNKNNGIQPVILSHAGRALTEKQEKEDGKYWNYPFFKGLEIYNQDNLLLDKEAREQITSYGLILVEGYFDTAVLVSAGVLNVGAIMGSNLTFGQVTRLKVINSHLKIPKITLFLDRDESGVSGSEKSALTLLRHGFSVSLFNWGDFSDIPGKIKDPGDMEIEQLKNLREQEKI